MPMPISTTTSKEKETGVGTALETVFRVEVDLRDTNQDFRVDFDEAGKAGGYVRRAFEEGFAQELREHGVAIYHPISNVKQITVRRLDRQKKKEQK